jgi:F-type H+-transporting ATPase subunit alpha
MEIFKQPPYDPIPVAVQVAVIWAVQNGYVDQTPVARVKEFQTRFTEFLTTRKTEVLAAIAKEKTLGEASVARLKASADEFAQTWKLNISAVGHGQPA